MMSDIERLLTLNDSRLRDYLLAEDETERSKALEAVLTGIVQPRAREIVDSYVRTEWPLEQADVEDVLGQVTVRILHKLRAATVLDEEAIQNLEAYVVTLTRNCVHNFMRSRSPERTRMKSRFRYLFTHDARLSLWIADDVVLCGLRAWHESAEPEAELPAVQQAAAELWRPDSTNSSIVAILVRVGRPVRLTRLVSACLASMPAGDPAQAVNDDRVDAAQRDALESRQYLEVLWREIRALPIRQQSALLLNLREPESGNAVTLWLTLGIATIPEIAEAVQMSAEELAAAWEELPFDDNRIADHLGATRQQVINLRKSARERLTRRMALQDRRH